MMLAPPPGAARWMDEALDQRGLGGLEPKPGFVEPAYDHGPSEQDFCGVRDEELDKSHLAQLVAACLVGLARVRCHPSAVHEWPARLR
jgi:hypothetical protein